MSDAGRPCPIIRAREILRRQICYNEPAVELAFAGTERFQILRPLGEGGDGRGLRGARSRAERPHRAQDAAQAHARGHWPLQARVPRASGRAPPEPRQPRRALRDRRPLVLHHGARRGHRLPLVGAPGRGRAAAGQARLRRLHAARPPRRRAPARRAHPARARARRAARGRQGPPRHQAVERPGHAGGARRRSSTSASSPTPPPTSRRAWRPSSAPPTTWRPSRRRARRSAPPPTGTRSACCSSRRSPGGCPSTARRCRSSSTSSRREPPPPSQFAPVRATTLDALTRALLATDPEARPSAATRCCAGSARRRPSRARSRRRQLLPVRRPRCRASRACRARSRTCDAAARCSSRCAASRAWARARSSRHFTDQLRVEVPDLARPVGALLRARVGALQGARRRRWTGWRATSCASIAIDAALIVGDEAALVARLFPVLLRVAGDRGAPPPRRPRWRIRRSCAAAPSRRCASCSPRLGERQPQVLVIDDLQWADADCSLCSPSSCARPTRRGCCSSSRHARRDESLAVLARLRDDVRLVDARRPRPAKTRTRSRASCRRT